MRNLNEKNDLKSNLADEIGIQLNTSIDKSSIKKINTSIVHNNNRGFLAFKLAKNIGPDIITNKKSNNSI
jgi:hypothetical protein